jgi:hypothetical protein
MSLNVPYDPIGRSLNTCIDVVSLEFNDLIAFFDRITLSHQPARDDPPIHGDAHHWHSYYR